MYVVCDMSTKQSSALLRLQLWKICGAKRDHRGSIGNGTQNNNQLTLWLGLVEERWDDLYKLTSWSNSHGFLKRDEHISCCTAADLYFFSAFSRRVRDRDDDHYDLDFNLPCCALRAREAHTVLSLREKRLKREKAHNARETTSS